MSGFLSLQKNWQRLQGQLPSFAGTPFEVLDGERIRSSQRWQASGLPTRALEDWKYTSVATIADSELVELGEEAANKVELGEILQHSRLNLKTAIELVFVNGQFAPSRSRLSNKSTFFLSSFSQVTRLGSGGASGDSLESKWPGLTRALENVRGAGHQGIENAFASINSSLFRDGVVLYVPDGVVIEEPIVLTFLTCVSNDPKTPEVLPTFHPRVLVALGRRASVSVLEQSMGRDGSRYFSNGVADFLVGDNAHLSYVRLQRDGRDAINLVTTRMSLGNSSRLESLQLSLGAQLARQDLQVRFASPGGEAVVNGLYVVRGNQHVDNHTSIEHAVGQTVSEQTYKGILDDNARAVFNGRICIAEKAQKSSAAQLNRNLLLSSKAEIDTKPELEIFADDVKAAHGATVGRLDPEHLFYLRSRAISETLALGMLAQGFAQDVVLQLSNVSLREALMKPVADALTGLKSPPQVKS